MQMADKITMRPVEALIPYAATMHGTSTSWR
jgi:hypothetical protein